MLELNCYKCLHHVHGDEAACDSCGGDNFRDVEEEIQKRDAEIAALKARLAGTVYDGTEATLPPALITVLAADKDNIGFYQRDDQGEAMIGNISIGDTWWPLPGGGE